MVFQQQEISLFLVRNPVPNGRACDSMSGKTCEDCQLYYDPRSGYGNNNQGKCVWVPHEGKCYSNLWATGGYGNYNDWIVDEVCDGQFR